MSRTRKTADNYLEITKEDIDFAESKYGVEIIGWCSDADGDSRGMRVRLGRQRPWLVAGPSG